MDARRHQSEEPSQYSAYNGGFLIYFLFLFLLTIE